MQKLDLSKAASWEFDKEAVIAVSVVDNGEDSYAVFFESVEEYKSWRDWFQGTKKCYRCEVFAKGEEAPQFVACF